MEHSTYILENVLILLFYSIVSIAAFRTFKLPPILGYLLVGVVLGSNALHWIPQNHAIELMGEIGVVFLLFAIGLEFSFTQLLSMKKIVFGLGTLQVGLVTALGAGILYYFGTPLQGAIIAGGAIAMSSTAIVMKQLVEQGEMRSRHGRLAFGILLMQDLAVVPFLVAIPILAGQGGHSDAILWVGLAKGALIFVGMLLFGHFALRPLFHFVTKKESIELFTLTVLMVALMASWVTNSLGLSLALGAFIAGMMLSETEFKHQIETEIRPFRDILMGIFFITIGTKLDLAALPEIWLSVLLLVLGLTVGKTILIAVLARMFTTENGSSFRTGLVLAQGGEFGFALLTLALSGNLLPEATSQTVLAAIIISMAISPIIIRYNGKLAKILFPDSTMIKRPKETKDFSDAVSDIDDHVVICGYRRIGQNLGRFLREQGIKYIALDLDPKIIKQAWEAGENIFYGDAKHPEILTAAGIKRARMVIVTTNHPGTSKQIIESVRSQNSKVRILVRTRDDMHMEDMERAGATDVIPETLEATMMVAQRVLEALDVDPQEAIHTIDKIRLDRYNTLRSYFRGDKRSQAEGVHEDSHLHTLILRRGDFAVDHEIYDLAPEMFNVKIASLRRGQVRGDLPSPNTLLRKGDTLIIQGSQENFERFVELLQRGPDEDPTDMETEIIEERAAKEQPKKMVINS
ncbi:MAG: Glutathione-regulated potassium-efflux system protein KefB [uncultured Thiotrichaceae bacterium]|uniref:Glutathione-regulated potassium-efflux system protein KefB n=1 Tax=uncultured Thiotrichaceae bacterium TaxID=298394 RepID=A0A6S6TZZ0_9GAMM|nr:MAG: Glutathione-regulated potassium-efflux system protein KefB [uncultured Thiotrichaceae bacterium]